MYTTINKCKIKQNETLKRNKKKYCQFEGSKKFKLKSIVIVLEKNTLSLTEES